MAKRKGLSKDERLINALKNLPNPLEDKKHRIFIYFVDDRARSNQSRFEHISLLRHDLRPSDIRKIVSQINNSVMRKDVERKDTYNLYIVRDKNTKELIKISLEIDFKKSNKATVKTIFIAKNIK